MGKWSRTMKKPAVFCRIVVSLAFHPVKSALDSAPHVRLVAAGFRGTVTVRKPFSRAKLHGSVLAANGSVPVAYSRRFLTPSASGSARSPATLGLYALAPKWADRHEA